MEYQLQAVWVAGRFFSETIAISMDGNRRHKTNTLLVMDFGRFAWKPLLTTCICPMPNETCQLCCIRWPSTSWRFDHCCKWPQRLEINECEPRGWHTVSYPADASNLVLHCVWIHATKTGVTPNFIKNSIHTQTEKQERQTTNKLDNTRFEWLRQGNRKERNNTG